MIRPEDLLCPTPKGLYCPPGDFYIDPVRGGVDRAVVTHGHSDHARAGHGAVLAIGAGVVGANVEDRLRPLAEAAANVEAMIRAGEAEGVPFVLNARTDAFVRGGGRPVAESLADAIERGTAFIEAGAACVFVPGILDADTTRALVDGIGHGNLSVIGLPGALASTEYETLGVARISYGPMPQRVALTALQDNAAEIYAGGIIPAGTRALN